MYSVKKNKENFPGSLFKFKNFIQILNSINDRVNFNNYLIH